MASLDRGENVFQDTIATCTTGSATYDLAHAADSHYSVSHEFARAVCSLPVDGGSDSDYFRFFDEWGTVRRICNSSRRHSLVLIIKIHVSMMFIYLLFRVL